MGRPPKLTDHQKAEIGRRLAKGESMASLAKEFKVGRATMTRVFSGRVQNIEKVATSLATAELEMERLPVSEQVSIRTLADQLKGLQTDYLASAAKGLQTSKILQGIAHKKAQALDSETIVTEDLRLVAALTDTANKASSMGTSILNANKDAGKSEAKRTLEDILAGGE